MLTILQKKACRAIHNLPFNTHTTEYFKKSNILKLTDLYESQITQKKIKCLNLNANILPKLSIIHNYYIRNNNKFISPKCSLRKSEMFRNFKSIKVLNKLPADIRSSDSLNVFIDNLRTIISHCTEFIMCIVYFYDMLYLCVMCYE